jgi:hypothetical protein
MSDFSHKRFVLCLVSIFLLSQEYKLNGCDIDINVDVILIPAVNIILIPGFRTSNYSVFRAQGPMEFESLKNNVILDLEKAEEKLMLR